MRKLLEIPRCLTILLVLMSSLCIAPSCSDYYAERIPFAAEESVREPEPSEITSLIERYGYPGMVLSPTLLGEYRRIGRELPKIGDWPSEPAQAPVIGTRTILVIRVDFADRPGTQTQAYFNDLIFGTTQGKLKHYFNEVSYGQLAITGMVSSSWRRSSRNLAWWGADGTGIDNLNGAIFELAREAVQLMDPLFNFAIFDTNGDGVITPNELNLCIVHAGNGQESTGVATDIWSHRWYIYGAGYTYSGVPLADTFVDGKRISRHPGDDAGGYFMQAETSPMGTFAHEFGHDLGLPDLYDTDYTSDGVGYWCLMSFGSWLGSPGGACPAHPSAFCKAMLGWCPPTVVTSNLFNTQIIQIETSKIQSLFKLPISHYEYFLVENRQKTGYDAFLPGSGILIWHVDNSRTSNNDEFYKRVDLEEAHGGIQHLDYRTDWNLGDADDPYHEIKEFGHSTDPSSVAVRNVKTGFGVRCLGPSTQKVPTHLLTPDYAAWPHVSLANDGAEAATISGSGWLDVQQLAAAGDGSTIVFKITKYASTPADTNFNPYGYVELDTDMNPATGMSWQGMGVDYEIYYDRYGAQLYRWSSSFTFVKYLPTFGGSDTAFLTIPVLLADIGSPTMIRVSLDTYEGVYDYVQQQKQVFLTSSKVITLDGSPGDWTGVTPILSDKVGDIVNPQFDFTNFYLTNDATRIFHRFNVAGTPITRITGAYRLDWHVWTYYDTNLDGWFDYEVECRFSAYQDTATTYLSLYHWTGSTWDLFWGRSDAAAFNFIFEFAVPFSQLGLSFAGTCVVYVYRLFAHLHDYVPNSGYVELNPASIPPPAPRLGDTIRSVFEATSTLGFMKTGNIYDDSSVGFMYAHKSGSRILFTKTDTTRVSPAGIPTWNGYNELITVGGRLANPTVAYYEDQGKALLKYAGDATNHIIVTKTGLTKLSVPISSISQSNDYFVMEVVMDGSHRIVMFWGLAHWGTYASGVYFDAIFGDPSFSQTWYIVRWQDLNGNLTHDYPDEFTIVASGT